MITFAEAKEIVRAAEEPTRTQGTGTRRLARLSTSWPTPNGTGWTL
jgi:hypothetical protein